MASLAAVGFSPVVMSAAAAKGEKQGLLDWLNDALRKGELSEMDPILQKDSAAPGPPKPSPAPAKKAPPKKQGGGFFGLGKK